MSPEQHTSRDHERDPEMNPKPQAIVGPSQWCDFSHRLGARCLRRRKLGCDQLPYQPAQAGIEQWLDIAEALFEIAWKPEDKHGKTMSGERQQGNIDNVLLIRSSCSNCEGTHAHAQEAIVLIH